MGGKNFFEISVRIRPLSALIIVKGIFRRRRTFKNPEARGRYPAKREEASPLTEQALDNLARRVMLDAARQEYGALMDECREHEFSPEFEKKMRKLTRRADHPIRWCWIRAGQIAAVLSALAVLASVAAAAAGYDLWKLLARWTAEQMTLAPGQIDYMAPDDLHIPEEPGEYADIQEALSAYGVDLPLVPHRFPEGFMMQQLVVDDTTSLSQIVFAALYSRGEDCLVLQVDIYVEQEYREHDDFGNFQKDEGDPVPYETGGVTHLLATNAGRPVALWADGPAECAISGDITMDELKDMLNSIYE